MPKPWMKARCLVGEAGAGAGDGQRLTGGDVDGAAGHVRGRGFVEREPAVDVEQALVVEGRRDGVDRVASADGVGGEDGAGVGQRPRGHRQHGVRPEPRRLVEVEAEGAGVGETESRSQNTIKRDFINSIHPERTSWPVSHLQGLIGFYGLGLKGDLRTSGSASMYPHSALAKQPRAF